MQSFVSSCVLVLSCVFCFVFGVCVWKGLGKQRVVDDGIKSRGEVPGERPLSVEGDTKGGEVECRKRVEGD